MFGRGGEEIQALQQAGVEVSVISGLTSGMAVPATLNIPLTHRDYTQGVTFITGHTQNGNAPDWQALAAAKTTLVIYMGMTNLDEITRQLMLHGMAKNMPAAVIQNGTLPDQRHVLCTLQTLAQTVLLEGLTSPSIVVIGEVTKFATATEHMAMPDKLLQAA